MKGKITRTTSKAPGETDFKRLRRMRDADIDDSDIPRLDKSFWKTAKLTMAEPKDRLTIRVTMMLSNDSRRPEAATRPTSTPSCAPT